MAEFRDRIEALRRVGAHWRDTLDLISSKTSDLEDGLAAVAAALAEVGVVASEAPEVVCLRGTFNFDDALFDTAEPEVTLNFGEPIPAGAFGIWVTVTVETTLTNGDTSDNYFLADVEVSPGAASSVELSGPASLGTIVSCNPAEDFQATIRIHGDDGAETPVPLNTLTAGSFVITVSYLLPKEITDVYP